MVPNIMASLVEVDGPTGEEKDIDCSDVQSLDKSNSGF